MEQIKINKLEIENVKRVKAVKLEPTKNGLTIIGGNNSQGKTSVLDAIAWALGGNKFRPSEAHREGSTIPPNLRVELSNGLIVERKGKNSELKITDPSGKKAGQNLLDSFVAELALDLPKFMNSNNKEKANILLEIIGVGEQLYELEKKETKLYNERHAIGQIADQKKKFAEEQKHYPEAPKSAISISELIQEQQKILAKNAENQKHRNNLKELLKGEEDDKREYALLVEQIEELTKRKNRIGTQINTRIEHIEIAQKTVEELVDESTKELEASIQNIEAINHKVSANISRERALNEASEYREQYGELTEKINEVRKAKLDLLDSAKLPLAGLNVQDGELTYKGFKWDGMSSAEQLKVATAIVKELKPQCGFVLMDKLEQMDVDSLKEFGTWLENEGLQVIATRVSKGEECTLIIEDGYALEEVKKTWEAGKF